MTEHLRAIAADNERIIAAGGYRTPGGHYVSLTSRVRAAVQGTRMYGPEPVPIITRGEATTVISVTGESSLAAARRMLDTDPEPVAVLNFASARNPGGHYLAGARTQEEALCRASALYTTLLAVPQYYEHHRGTPDPFYSDRVILSPAVPVFRDDTGILLDDPYTVGFLTCPAPRTNVIAQELPGEAYRVPEVLATRAERILETAVDYRRLVLGAWGCGAYGNDPGMVAGVFHALLADGGRFNGHFDEITFAILDRTAGETTRTAFRTVLAAA
ncbi:TIGR02452 family protein [Nocardia sp. NBC_01503]|uniref:TIGR02452 family protein n=1 Tax=Nocardia sp. NBC_01503 TaxID=2975997 RepID=UPI002E7BB744|nr:TIGR02452 family protein [Nocardia sp. NBC_01503]WTL32437.1 TIGR02452 family protein [Nocardia sp. NBC_01503]